jgi:hypothetical protein
MGDATSDQTVFLTWVYSPRQRWCARVLVEGIRAFGGALSHCPVWLYEANPERVPCGDLEDLGVRVLSLEVPDTVRGYILASKVCACARAEALAAPEVRSLIWLSPECLIARPPVLFDLCRSFDAAVRPVHIKNVGLLATERPDAFWSGVYEAVGVRDVEITVESFVDVQHIRAYYNSAAFAIRPSTGLFRRWFECFEALVGNEAFQSRACQDEWHQIFLHQAVLSTLISTALDPARVRTLPPDYGYPYNLHGSVLPERRARTLNELVCAVYEERTINPDRMDDIVVDEPLRSWLLDRARTEPTVD